MNYAAFEYVLSVHMADLPYAVFGFIDVTELTLRVRFLQKPRVSDVAEARARIREYVPVGVIVEFDFAHGGGREIVRG